MFITFIFHLISLKIKTKYALLRNLGGVALDSIEADDVDNICGNGEQPLLKSIRKTLTQLERKTRQLIVHSLEEDLVNIKTVVEVNATRGSGIPLRYDAPELCYPLR